MEGPSLRPNATPRVFTSQLSKLSRKPMPAPVSGALGKLLQLEELDRMYAELRASETGQENFPLRVLNLLGVKPVISPQDQANIPKSGSALVAANHPFGLIEGAVLATLLTRVRPDVKFLGNSMLAEFEELRDLLILVNPFGGPEASRENRRGMREAFDWLEAGHLLAVFPAGEVSAFDPKSGGITDPAWSPTIARLIRKSGAIAVPAYFDGANSVLFQIAGLIHPRLRTALIPHEFLNKRQRTIELRVGHPIPARKLALFQTDEELTAHLRERSYWLGQRGKRKMAAWKFPRKPKPIAEPARPEWLEEEFQALAPHRLLVASGDYQVYGATGHEMPTVLLELGRERERTFRQAGEGTANSRDLDKFDQWYTHIVVWHKRDRRIVGAYRICGTDTGAATLYTETLFKFQPGFFARIGPALELGRSFIAPEYQRGFHPLLLLWKGIAAHIALNPRYRYLFGPVSISNEYQPASRDLMAAYLRCAALDSDLSRLVKARRPFRSLPHRHLVSTRDIDEIESAVADVEPDSKGVPVLVRQYLRLGGRIAALHVDSKFGNTLDGLVVMDLLRAERKALERYFTPEGLARFLAAHSTTQSAA